MHTRLLPALLLTALTMAAAPAAGQSLPASAPAPAANPLDALVAQLKTEADAFAAATDGDTAPAASPAAKGTQFTAENIAGLGKALGGKYSSPLAELYVYAQVADCLRMSAVDVLKKAQPAIAMMWGKCQYKAMPALPPEIMRDLKAADAPAGADFEKAIAAMHKARDRKKALQDPVVRWNRTVAALEKSLKQCLAVMDLPAGDDALLRKLDEENRAGSANYAVTLDIIKDEGAKMNKARARKFYDALLKLANAAGTAGKSYMDPAKVTPRTETADAFASTTEYFCIKCLETVNVLAPQVNDPAKAPAQRVPTAQELSDFNKRGQPPPRRGGR